jgi:single-strand DNA-binding protein
MAGINKVILVGHLGKTPEFKYLEGHVAVATFPLATSEMVTKNGDKMEITEWHHIIMWRALAEAAAKVLIKGKLIHLEGKCRTRSFEDQAGIKRYTTEIVADTFTPLGRPADSDEEYRPDTVAVITSR